MTPHDRLSVLENALIAAGPEPGSAQFYEDARYETLAWRAAIEDPSTTGGLGVRGGESFEDRLVDLLSLETYVLSNGEAARRAQKAGLLAGVRWVAKTLHGLLRAEYFGPVEKVFIRAYVVQLYARLWPDLGVAGLVAQLRDVGVDGRLVNKVLSSQGSMLALFCQCGCGELAADGRAYVDDTHQKRQQIRRYRSGRRCAIGQ